MYVCMYGWQREFLRGGILSSSSSDFCHSVFSSAASAFSPSSPEACAGKSVWGIVGRGTAASDAGSLAFIILDVSNTPSSVSSNISSSAAAGGFAAAAAAAAAALAASSSYRLIELL